MCQSPSEKLEDILEKGIVADIFRMERAYLLLKEIGKNVDVLNAPETGNFGMFFGVTQQALRTEAALAAARIYDKPSQKYPTRCLRAALQLLEDHGKGLPEITERWHTKCALREFCDDAGVVESVDRGKDEFLRKFTPMFSAILDDPDVRAKIKQLKNLRDKQIAHNEAAQKGGPTWKALTELIDYAKGFVGVVGWAFYNTVYVHDGKYMLTDDAQRPSLCLRRLADRLREFGTKQG